MSADTFSRVLDRWDSAAMRRWRRALAQELLAKKLIDVEPRTIDEVVDFFEDLGVMVEKKWLDTDAVWQSFATAARHYWVAVQQYIVDLRKESDDGTYYSEFESLVKTLEREEMRRQKAKSPSDVAITSEMAQRFLGSEATMDT